MSRFTDVFVTPPAVFVAVIIGGGYGTGREVVEFFSRFGLVGGLLGICVATLLFALVFGLTFDFARRQGAYEYREFFQALIGRFWWSFELLYVVLALLVLGVLSAAAGEMLLSEFGIPPRLGLVLVLSLVALLVFFGREALERVFTAWTLCMYAVFVAYFALMFSALSGSPVNSQPTGESGGWLSGGALYVMYNAAVAPVLLFAVRGIRSGREARLSGLTTALALMFPAVLLHISFSLGASGALEQPVPVYWMIEHHAPGFFRGVFVLALLGTLIQTGAGLVQGFIERVSRALVPARDEGLGHWTRAAIAAAALLLSWLLAQFGVIALVARGYTLLAIGFALVYVLPLFVRSLVRFSGNRS